MFAMWLYLPLAVPALLKYSVTHEAQKWVCWGNRQRSAVSQLIDFTLMRTISVMMLLYSWWSKCVVYFLIKCWVIQAVLLKSIYYLYIFADAQFYFPLSLFSLARCVVYLYWIINWNRPTEIYRDIYIYRPTSSYTYMFNSSLFLICYCFTHVLWIVEKLLFQRRFLALWVSL